SGQTRFDDVDPELLELARDNHLLLSGHARAGRLLAVTRGIKNLYYVWVIDISHFESPHWLIRWPAQKQKLPRPGQREYQFAFDWSRDLTASLAPPPVSSPAGACRSLSTIKRDPITCTVRQ